MSHKTSELRRGHVPVTIVIRQALPDAAEKRIREQPAIRDELDRAARGQHLPCRARKSPFHGPRRLRGATGNDPLCHEPTEAGIQDEELVLRVVHFPGELVKRLHRYVGSCLVVTVVRDDVASRFTTEILGVSVAGEVHQHTVAGFQPWREVVFEKGEDVAFGRPFIEEGVDLKPVPAKKRRRLSGVSYGKIEISPLA